MEKAKTWYRDALAKIKAINEEAGLDVPFSANSAVKSNVEDQVRAEISQKLSESFDNLAMAATSKAETNEAQTQTIAAFTATNATLVATNAVLTSEANCFPQGPSQDHIHTRTSRPSWDCHELCGRTVSHRERKGWQKGQRQEGLFCHPPALQDLQQKREARTQGLP